MLLPHDKVPNELWMDIFESMDAPQDLHSVVLTCKKFYFCGIRALLRDIIWSTPSHVLTNLPIWANQGQGPGQGQGKDVDRPSQLAADVRSLCLNISTVPSSYPCTFIDEYGGATQGPLDPALYAEDDQNQLLLSMGMLRSLMYYRIAERHYFATPPLYLTMCRRIASFTNLERLECRDLIFTDNLLEVIHSLPALRSLEIELCIFPSRQVMKTRDHSVLPITELKLLNLRRRVTQGHGFAPHAADIDEDLTHVLKLGQARNLRSLHIDSTADVLGRVYTVWDSTIPAYIYHVPQFLERLFISKKTSHRGQVQPQFPAEQFFPDRALYALFSRCATINTISLECQLPRHTTFPEDCLPNLRNLEGFAEAILSMGAIRPLEGISLLWSEGAAHSTLESLRMIAECHGSRLKMLALELSVWDDEILHAVCTLFRNLRRLKLTYASENEGPSEVRDNGAEPSNPLIDIRLFYDQSTIVSLGPLFLSNLPNLHTVQVYHTPQGSEPSALSYPPSGSLYDSTFESIGEEMRDLVIPWNRYCKNLKEVQLSAGWKLARVGVKGRWEVQRVRKMEVEDFRC
ncbi:hypothetical protein BXZ70DRAFT_495344 [Cristinia sonorae]|uniref:F-box domain-containing protein n=1 Tax=Cristinia sonorae TaxID=1940300 RepID=A0A8K0UIS8_9AGAR|nr:hypothetical protein BXZ70DRAFT_495344 [Cristinia sonorae]